MKSLSKNDLLAVLEIAERAGKAASTADLGALIQKVMATLPIRAMDMRVAAIGAEGQIVGTTPVVSLNFPQRWLDDYRSRSLRAIDPVASRLFFSTGPIVWSRLRAQSQSQSDKSFYDAASEYGLADGFSIGRRFGDRRSGSFVSCIGDDLSKSRRNEIISNLVAPHLHAALARCRLARPTKDISLTAREVEVLYGAMGGMTNTEIATDLGISGRAVKFHLENAIEKLGAKNRTEAVVVALARGILEW